MQSIFGTYDIRGRFGLNLTKETAYFLGQAFFTFLKRLYGKNPRIVLALDLRPHSKILGAYFKKGFEKMGGRVKYLGILPSPIFYFAITAGKFHGGCMVTASHLPAEFNGFYLADRNALTIGQPTGLKDLEKIFYSVTKEKPPSGPKVKFLDRKIEFKIISRYLKENLNLFDFKAKRKVKIAVDFKNSVAIVMAKDLGVILKRLNIGLVKNSKIAVDLYVSFDQDADRIYFGDEKKREILPDEIALKIVERNFNGCGRFVAAINTSKEIREKIEESHGKVFLSRVGHTFIKELMRKVRANFGYEASGHYFIDRFSYAESPAYILFSVLRILSESNQKTSRIFRMNRYFIYPEINFPVKDRDAVMGKVRSVYGNKAERISELDGLTLEFNDFWFNIRKSQTENLIRLRLEAKDEKAARLKLKEIKSLIN